MQIVFSLIFFIIAAGLGTMLIRKLFDNTHPPKGMVLWHGGVALIGLTMLIISNINFPSPWLLASLIFFVGAAIGGGTMFYLDMSGKVIPKWLAVGHASAAVTGLILLIIAFIRFF